MTTMANLTIRPFEIHVPHCMVTAGKVRIRADDAPLQASGRI